MRRRSRCGIVLLEERGQLFRGHRGKIVRALRRPRPISASRHGSNVPSGFIKGLLSERWD